MAMRREKFAGSRAARARPSGLPTAAPAAAAAFSDPAVAAVFAAFPERLRARLLELRALILDTAKATPCVGEIVETLKWGEPAYLPKTPRVGTTVRVNALKGSADRYVVYFPCQTTLVETFRERYPETFRFQGNRAIVFAIGDRLPTKALRHCVALALTYHLDARALTVSTLVRATSSDRGRAPR